jgi:adenosylcobinamide-GDP ribazoletransferase
VALVVSIAGRAAFVAELGGASLWILPLVGCAARVGPIWLMARLPYVTATQAAKSRDVTGAGTGQAIVATMWCVVATAAAIAGGWLSVARAAALLVGMAIVAAATGFRYRQRVGGITGDFLGATEQLGELAALAVLAWRV